jgi:hypothetical protein
MRDLLRKALDKFLVSARNGGIGDPVPIWRLRDSLEDLE